MPQFLEHSGTSWQGQNVKHTPSLIDRLDPRLRVVLVSVFAVVTVLSQSFMSLSMAAAMGLLLALLAQLNIKRTLRRVLAMDMFMIFLIILLPFTTPGETWFEVAGLSASKAGFLHALMILLKAHAVVLALLAMVGTLSATTLGHALARLRVPDKLVHLMLFTVRYLEVIGQEYKRMRRAMQARAFVLRTNRHTWRAIGYLVGMLLVHSLERSERIMAAMKCRGYQGKFYLFDDMTFTRQDVTFSLLFVPCLGLLIGMNFL
ncbi:Energy-coupling factor transporter transmembrane protein EcfT [Marinomonas aquimarina]|uniref:Energy-coupling factor transporter transmembrane protein EcfT n=1 Tax=Marinomonas aquimarina TaxID=295068 RepID=A0A1A8TLG6_9GAMM|nr:cobalt ECF transporter T component CbiQ [Marinomonas aquimarina]SBS33310.1 Energy-coupling factor transporter transmembrane protein EcfT [Marinomonas aquimarina]